MPGVAELSLRAWSNRCVSPDRAWSVSINRQAGGGATRATGRLECSCDDTLHSLPGTYARKRIRKPRTARLPPGPKQCPHLGKSECKQTCALEGGPCRAFDRRIRRQLGCGKPRHQTPYWDGAPSALGRRLAHVTGSEAIPSPLAPAHRQGMPVLRSAFAGGEGRECPHCVLMWRIHQNRGPQILLWIIVPARGYRAGRCDRCAARGNVRGHLRRYPTFHLPAGAARHSLAAAFV